MIWTSEPPTLPGYYWWRACVNTEPMLVLLGYFRSLDTQLSVIWPQGNVTGVQYANRMGGQWAIPNFNPWMNQKWSSGATPQMFGMKEKGE